MSQTQTQVQAPIQHAIHWFEIPVSDMARSVAFYERLLDVQLRLETIGGQALAVFPGDQEQGVKGCLIKVDRAPAHTDGVLIYLNAGPVLNTVLDRLATCGGRLLTPRVELPDGMGCFAHFTDPDGQRIGLHALA